MQLKEEIAQTVKKFGLTKSFASLLATLSDEGFLIYSEENGWRLKKIPVPNNSRLDLISSEEGVADASVLSFSEYEGALKKAMELIEWDFPKKEPLIWFVAMVNYNLGFGPTIRELGKFQSLLDLAQTKAEELANNYFKGDVDTKDRTWEEMDVFVAIRPCPPPPK